MFLLDEKDKTWKQHQMFLGTERMMGEPVVGSAAKWFIKYSDIDTVTFGKGTDTLKRFPFIPCQPDGCSFTVKTMRGNAIDFGTINPEY